MNRKMLPLIMMLAAGAVTSIVTYIRNYTILEKLIVLLITLLVFYGIGRFMEYMLDSFEKQNEKVRLASEEAALESEQQGEEEQK